MEQTLADQNQMDACSAVAPASRAGWMLAMGLLALSLASLAWRGPWRAMDNSRDFGLYYCSTRAFLDGGDPYLVGNLQSIAAATGAPTNFLDNAIAPPFTYVVLAPFAVMDFASAKVCWMGFNLLMAALLVHWLSIWAGVRPTLTNARGVLLIAMTLGLAPLATCVGFGQLAIASTAWLGGAMYMHRRGRPMTAGLMLGLSGLFKPQIALAFVLYWLVRRRWRGLLAAGATVAPALVLSAVKLHAVYPEFVQSWQNNIRHCFNGGLGDYASPASAHILMSLHYAVYAWTQSRAVADVVPWIFAILLLAGAVAFWRRARVAGESAETLLLALLAVLGMLPVYHVYYDGVLLAVPVCWAFGALQGPLKKYALATLALAAPFLVSGAAFTAYYGPHWLPPSAWTSWWVQKLILPQQSYLLSALCVVLALAMRKLATAATSCDTRS